MHRGGGGGNEKDAVTFSRKRFYFVVCVIVAGPCPCLTMTCAVSFPAIGNNGAILFLLLFIEV